MATNYVPYHNSNVTNMTNPHRNESTLTGMIYLNERDINALNKLYADNLLPVSIIWGILALLGLIGNCVVLAAFKFGKHLQHRPLRGYIMGLAVVDVISCSVLMPVEIYKQSNYFSAMKMEYCKGKCFVHIFCMSSTTFILIAVAANRFIATTRPLSVVHQHVAATFARKLVIWFSIFSGAILLAIPGALLCGSYYVTVNNVTALACGSDEKTKDSIFRFIYKAVLGILQVVSSLILIILYGRIARTIRRKSVSVTSGTSICMTFDESGKFRKRLGNRLPTNTKILFIVTMIFIVTYLILVILSFIELSTIPVNYFPLYAFFLRLYFLHSVMLPVLYMKMDQGLRVELFSRCFRGRPNVTRQRSTSSGNSVM